MQYKQSGGVPIRGYNLALIGFGNVGKALVRLLAAKTDELRRAHGIEWKLTGVASRRIGWIANHEGISPEDALEGKFSGQRPFLGKHLGERSAEDSSASTENFSAREISQHAALKSGPQRSEPEKSGSQQSNPKTPEADRARFAIETNPSAAEAGLQNRSDAARLKACPDENCCCGLHAGSPRLQQPSPENRGPEKPAAKNFGENSAPQNVREWLADARADVLFEASSLEKHTGEPAISHLRAALELGAHAISANKGPVVHAYRELRALAAERGRKFLFESAVMDGTPIFSLFPHALPAVELRGFRGLLNSTSNVVLTQMEKGMTFEQAVRRAQEIGVAETDPSDDLDGWDAAVKTAALAIVLMGANITLADVQRTGIRGITPEQVREARAAGRRYKLICRAERVASQTTGEKTGEKAGGKVRLSVAPEELPLDDPFALLEGTTSALKLDMDVFGLSMIEHKPGVVATAYGLLADFVRAVAE